MPTPNAKAKQKMVNFKGVEAAKASQGGNYIGPCDGLFRIDKVKEGESRKGDGFIVIEMTAFHMFEGSHVVGENVAHMLMQKFDSFLGNWKAFVMGVSGCAETEVTEEESDVIIGEGQPFSGDVVRVKARNIQTKAGGDFTVVNYHGTVPAEEWRPVVEEAGNLAKLGME